MISLLLGVGVLDAATLAGIDELRIPGHIFKKFLAGQIVIDDNFSPFQKLLAANCYQARVTRPGRRAISAA